MLIATANHAAAGVVVAFAVGLPVIIVGLSIMAAILAGKGENR